MGLWEARGVMADSQVSGLSRATEGRGTRWWGSGIGVQVAETLRSKRVCGIEPLGAAWFQSDGGEDMELGRGENSSKNSSCEGGERSGWHGG